jgi:hypothetical protein
VRKYIHISRNCLHFALVAAALSIGCRHSHEVSGPTLKETTDWMQQSLVAHNGHRLDNTLGKDVKIVSTLTANGCNLDYVVTNYETVHYDLRDIDPTTIKTKKIGQATWVVFDTRNFNRSVRYTHASDPALDYAVESGGFALDTDEHALSFLKALQHATVLCGGKPSTF